MSEGQSERLKRWRGGVALEVVDGKVWATREGVVERWGLR